MEKVRKWLTDNEPFIGVGYRVLVLFALFSMIGAIKHADPGWHLSEILDLLRRR